MGSRALKADAWFVFVLPLLAVNAHAACAPSPRLRVLMIGLGGTIAGKLDKPNDAHYVAGSVSAEAITAAVPDIGSRVELTTRQLTNPDRITLGNPTGLVNVQSSQITESDWLKLSRDVQHAVDTECFDAVIVTEGTDNMEDTSFFLQTSVHTDKPVVMVGSMRPENHSDPDGPDNLRTAFRAIMDPESKAKGVMIADNFKVYSALDFTKVRTYPANLPGRHEKLPDPFVSPNYGPMAKVTKKGDDFTQWTIKWQKTNPLVGSNPRFPGAAAGLNIKFDYGNRTSLPRVRVLMDYIGSDTANDLNDMYLPKGENAFVVVGSGNGAMTQLEQYVGVASNDPNRIFLRGGTPQETFVDFEGPAQTTAHGLAHRYPGTVGVGTLTWRHAKILLQGALASIQDGKSLGSLADGKSGIRDKIKAFMAQKLPYPYQSGPKGEWAQDGCAQAVKSGIQNLAAPLRP